MRNTYLSCINCLSFSLPTYFLTPLISDFSSLPWPNKLQRINTLLPPGSSMREQEVVEFKKSRNIRKLWKSKQHKMHWRSINATHILNRKIKHSQSGNPRINCSHFKTKVRCHAPSMLAQQQNYKSSLRDNFIRAVEHD